MAFNKILSIVIVALFSIASILFIVATALPTWVKSDVPVLVTAGIWKTCIMGNCIALPFKDHSKREQIYAARAFMIMTCIFLPICALLGILYVLLKHGFDRIIAASLKILSTVTVICGILGLGAGLSGLSGGDGTIGAATIVGIIGVIFNMIGTVASYLLEL